MTMRHPRLLVATALVSVVLAGRTPVAAAPAEPTQCAVIDRSLICGYAVDRPRAQPVARQASGEPTAVWTREWVNRRPEGDANVLDRCTTADGRPGTRYRDTLLSATGEVLNSVITCVGDGEPAPTAAVPPPAPPTREELIASAPIPRPVIGRNPTGRGLTGLESWFWASGGTTVEASVTLRGWTVTGTLGAGTLTWDTGDGGRYQTAEPGTAQAPAVAHMYERKGTWPVTVDVSWSGSYTISGFGTSFTVDGLTTTGTASVDYEVIEVRSVLDEQARS
jgi:hypothetical protein